MRLDELPDLIAAIKQECADEEGSQEIAFRWCLHLLGEAFPKERNVLFDSIAHGAEDHRQWLRNEMEKWWDMP